MVLKCWNHLSNNKLKLSQMLSTNKADIIVSFFLHSAFQMQKEISQACIREEMKFFAAVKITYIYV